MSRQILAADSSVVIFVLAMTRTSRPAWMANACSTPWKPVAMRFQFLHPLDVAVERFAAGAGSRGAARVGGGDQHGVRHVGPNVVVVAEGGVDHFGAFAVAFEQVGADLAGGRLRCRDRRPCRCRAAGRRGGPGRRPCPFPRPSCRRRTPLRSNAAAHSGCSWCGSGAGPAGSRCVREGRGLAFPARPLRRSGEFAARFRSAFRRPVPRSAWDGCGRRR